MASAHVLPFPDRPARRLRDLLAQGDVIRDCLHREDWSRAEQMQTERRESLEAWFQSPSEQLPRDELVSLIQQLLADESRIRDLLITQRAAVMAASQQAHQSQRVARAYLQGGG